MFLFLIIFQYEQAVITRWPHVQFIEYYALIYKRIPPDSMSMAGQSGHSEPVQNCEISCIHYLLHAESANCEISPVTHCRFPHTTVINIIHTHIYAISTRIKITNCYRNYKLLQRRNGSAEGHITLQYNNIVIL